MTAARYTHGHDDSVLRSHRWRTVENSAAYLLPHLHAGVDLLDVGCGPGTITVDLARRVSPGRVVAVDAAADAVAAAASAAADAGLQIDVATGDADALDHPDASFDVVHAHQVLQHLADPVAALAEWRRVCRRGGIVAARDADYAAMAWWPASDGIARWLDLYRAVARQNGGEPDAGRRLVGWARAAGFQQVTPSASAWCFADAADRAWWADTWAARISETRLAEQIVETDLADRDELAAIADAWRSWRDADDGWFVVVHGEILCS